MEKVSANNRAVGGERMLKKVMPCQVLSKLSKIAEEVDDKRQRDSGRKIAAAAEDRRVGRPDRSTDVHSMHRNWAVDRPVDRNTLSTGTQTLGFSGSTARSTGRGGRSTQRSTDSRVWAENCCSENLGI